MNETKACPYCGEEILAVAVKCKHCGSTIRDPSRSIKRHLRTRPALTILTLMVLTVGAVLAYNWERTRTLSGHGFTDTEIANVEQDIRVEFGRRTLVSVQDVEMIRQSPTQLTGFIKMSVPLLGTISKSCTASLGDGGQSIWQCD